MPESSRGKLRRWIASSSYDWFMLGFIAGSLWVGLVVWLVN